MKLSTILNYFFAGALVTCFIPFLFGSDVAKLFGVWVGIGAGILSWLFSSTVMCVFWCLSHRSRDRDASGKIPNAKNRETEEEP
jgi:hypothetical protein